MKDKYFSLVIVKHIKNLKICSAPRRYAYSIKKIVSMQNIDLEPAFARCSLVYFRRNHERSKQTRTAGPCRSLSLHCFNLDKSSVSRSQI